ncbi:MAG: bifunctional oligoribonuclease/PAP phosphatase NrnA [Ignavibacteria bacterium]|nr:MAG: bifunctional oligoribonuclease/PAP phosphatase NrnA [Ignavibacteria bacterium]
MRFKKLIDIFESNNKFVLTTHINPDADAIGSEMGLYYLLRELGKTVHIINHSETPYTLKFMDDDEIIERFDPQIHDDVILNSDVIIFLDLNSSNRVASMEDVCLKSGAVKVIIDHHTNPEDFVDYQFIFTEASSTGEIIYDIIYESGYKITKLKTAEVIYAAIMADTGSFHYDRTTPKIHKIAAELLQLGVQPDKIYEELYEKGTLGRLRLLGSALSSLNQAHDGKLTYMVIKKKDLENNGAVEADIEGFVGYTLSVEGTQIGLLFYDLDDGFKISFRSKGKIPVNKLAEEFGGGGHLNAAGARLNGESMDDVIPKVIASAKKYYKYY